MTKRVRKDKPTTVVQVSPWERHIIRDIFESHRKYELTHPNECDPDGTPLDPKYLAAIQKPIFRPLNVWRIYWGQCTARHLYYLRQFDIRHVFSLVTQEERTRLLPIHKKKGRNIRHDIKEYYYMLGDDDTQEERFINIVYLALPLMDAIYRGGVRAGAIFIHCTAGLSRSPALLCAWLAHHCKISWREALAQIDTVRYCVTLHPAFRRALERLYPSD